MFSSKRNPPRILALDPGTRYLGYAVFQGHDLLYYGVKVLSKESDGMANGAARQTVEEIIRHLKPTVLAIELSFHGRSRRMARQARLITMLQRLGRKHRLRTLRYAPQTIRKWLCGSGWAGKREVAYMVSYRYPVLRPYRIRDRQWKERFHGHMFDAVAVGLMALADIWPNS